MLLSDYKSFIQKLERIPTDRVIPFTTSEGKIAIYKRVGQTPALAGATSAWELKNEPYCSAYTIATTSNNSEVYLVSPANKVAMKNCFTKLTKNDFIGAKCGRIGGKTRRDATYSAFDVEQIVHKDKLVYTEPVPANLWD